MPRLPDSSFLGNRPTPTPNTGVIGYDPGGVARQVEGIGQAISQVGEEVSKKNDEQAVFEARRKLDEWERTKLYDPENGVVAKRGADALDLPKTIPGEFDAFASDVSGTLTSNRQRQVFQDMAAQRRNQVADFTVRHAVTQKEVYEKGQVSADMAAAGERSVLLASNGDTAGSKAELDIASGRLTSFMKARGASGEEIAGAIKENASRVHVNVIRSMQQRDPAAAKVYFEENKKQIDATLYDEITRPLEKIQAATDGDNAADAIWSAAGPKTDLQPVELDKMEAAARKQFAGDKPRMDAAIDGLRQRASAFNASERERSAANTNVVFGKLDQGMTFAQVVRSPEWNALPEKEQRQIRMSLEAEAASHESRAAARESRAAAAESRAYTAERRKEGQLLLANGDQYLTDSDPARLAAMTREQVVATRSKYGMEGAQHLLSRWDSLQKPGAVTEAKIDQDEFNRIADEAKLAPYATGKSEKAKAELGNLKAAVERRIDMAQQQAKRTLTREEKAKLMHEEVDNKVMLDVWGTDPSKPVSTVSANDMGKAYVMVGNEQVKLSSIPAEDRAQIMRSRMARGLPVTEADIAKTWVRGRSAAKTGAF